MSAPPGSDPSPDDAAQPAPGRTHGEPDVGGAPGARRDRAPFDPTAFDAATPPHADSAPLTVRPPDSAASIPERYRHSAGAAVVAAGLLGLREVIDPARHGDELVAEAEAAQGRTAMPVEVFLDPDDPAASMVVITDPADWN